MSFIRTTLTHGFWDGQDENDQTYWPYNEPGSFLGAALLVPNRVADCVDAVQCHRNSQVVGQEEK